MESEATYRIKSNLENVSSYVSVLASINTIKYTSGGSGKRVYSENNIADMRKEMSARLHSARLILPNGMQFETYIQEGRRDEIGERPYVGVKFSYDFAGEKGKFEVVPLGINVPKGLDDFVEDYEIAFRDMGAREVKMEVEEARKNLTLTGKGKFGDTGGPNTKRSKISKKVKPDLNIPD